MNLETVVTYANAAAAIPSIAAFVFDSPLSEPLAPRERVVAAASPMPDSYAFALEDLADLHDIDLYGPGEVSVSSEALDAGLAIVQSLQAVAPAPTISALANGVLSIVWPHSGGFISVEIGRHSYGLLAIRDGVPVRMKNGPLWELLALVPTDIRSLFPSTASRVPNQRFSFSLGFAPGQLLSSGVASL